MLSRPLLGAARLGALHSRRPIIPIPVRHFSGSSPDTDADSNHYETLNINESATKTEIKKRFYELSKAHHPDRNRNDPHAAKRFIKISAAYSILGNPKLREKYDRELARARGPRSSLHNAYSNPVGGRPASGLSRRRAPAASAYKNTTGFKRHPGGHRHGSGVGGASGPGMGPGGGMGYGAPSPSGTEKLYSQHEAAEIREQARRGRATVAITSVKRDIAAVITVSGILWFTVWSAGLGFGSKKEKKQA
ncbi:DnaJ domain-containing protein [Sphaerosporella brunnea]|uniref:DnaJ domain-containing protein n=1 Tax=Sphaerosporella brunnea TaxID=1250544 RepID=A0A5J5F3S5_9PEZI|nr:DnaJ domain-containing protein [Sphaerosporella brunnea]